MLEVLGLMIAQPEPPPITPEIAFISEAKQQIPPDAVPWFQRVNHQPWEVVAQAKDYCREPGQVQLPQALKDLAIKYFCLD